MSARVRRSTPQGLVIGTACPPVSAVLPRSAMPCVRRAGCRHASFAAFSQSPLLLQRPFCERPAFCFLGPCAPASHGTSKPSASTAASSTPLLH